MKVLAQWILLGTLVGTGCGLSSAAFLFLLERATAFRTGHLALVWALPLFGLVGGWLLQRYGENIRGGTNLVLDTFHEDRPQIPLRLVPMMLVGTVLTHCFGGSAGREGTAVQMGAGLADAVSHLLKVTRENRVRLIAAGIAGGFGSVFGTPLAGALFGLEVLAVGTLEVDALVPALVSALVGDQVTRRLGILHAAYPIPHALPLSLGVVLKWVVCGVAVGAVCVVFIEGTHRLKALLEKRLPTLAFRMALGGLGVVLLWRLFGTDRYLGLGMPTILRAFTDPALAHYDFAAKLVFTSVTLGSGFPGGEVTPLFFIGATLGNALASPLGLPLALTAAVCLASMFGAAANTPLALCVMAGELFGAAVFPHVAIVMVVAFLVSGHRGIYPAQRVFRFKHGRKPSQGVFALRDIHRTRP